MHIEAGELKYVEAEEKVFLIPWARLSRERMTLNGAGTVVHLQKGVIRRVETVDASGADEYPNRRLEYAAKQLAMDLTEKGDIQRITGHENAQLTSVTPDARTTMNSARIYLDFVSQSGETVLDQALAMENVRINSAPIAKPGRPAAATRILKSEVVEMKMRPGGQEIAELKTNAPGTLEFIPNSPGERPRRMDGDPIRLVYGAKNQLQTLLAEKVTTRTENPPRKGKPSPPSTTSSAHLSAEFAPDSGEMTKLEQWDQFRYEEGERQARSVRAVLDNARRRITLIDAARVWDPTGSTSADRIVLEQDSGDFQALGNVASTRLPDKKGSGSAMLSREEPLQAKAARMDAADGNKRIHYEGGVTLWQGANRLDANAVDIDREARRLEARGQVVSQMLDRPKKAGPKQEGAPLFTNIRAPEMIYSDEDRVAHYKGGVQLTRAGLRVDSRELRAFLSDKQEGASVDRAIADGSVEILMTAPARTRRGHSEHAEYFVGEEKVILEGNQPRLDDSLRGTTTGRQLTYFAGDDRLLVNGVEQRPAVSRIKRK